MYVNLIKILVIILYIYHNLDEVCIWTLVGSKFNLDNRVTNLKLLYSFLKLLKMGSYI